MSADPGSLGLLAGDPAPVYLETLGHHAAYRNGIHIPWSGYNVGANQLCQMSSYIVSKRDTPVRTDYLIELALVTKRSRKGCLPRDASYLLRGLRQFFARLGLDHAIERRGSTWILPRRPTLWATDLDLIDAWSAQAHVATSCGDRQAALGAWQSAETLCKGDYLPDFEAAYELGVEAEALHARDLQRRVRLALARCCLGFPDAACHQLALQVMQRATAADQDPELFAVAAEAAGRCGDEGLAGYYRRQIDE